ncbi:MAG: sulfotransferase, partial [Solirubrobacteraceae bacterium]
IEGWLIVSATEFGKDPSPQLHLLVGPARSGTTLLRILLDAHPAVGCPAEAGIPSLIRDLGRVWWTIDPEAQAETETEEFGLAGLPAQAKAAIREAIVAPMRHYCSIWGKDVYVDKSLDSVEHLHAVHELFPRGRYILLFRHVMDTVASGLEASPWGFQAYGYLPFVQRSPDNLVAALATYWLTHVSAALEWEKAHPELCLRLRYEDLVAAPEPTMASVFAFLGVTNDDSVLRVAFEQARSRGGPGDHKVTFESSVSSASVGRGKTVPVSMLTPPLLERLNETFAELGYAELGAAWNAEPSVTGARGAANPWAARLAQLVQTMRINPQVESNGNIGSIAMVAQDAEALRWVFDLRAGVIRAGDGEVERVIIGTTEDLVSLLSGAVNPGTMLRSGRIRHLTGDTESGSQTVVTQTLAALGLFKEQARLEPPEKRVGLG